MQWIVATAMLGAGCRSAPGSTPPSTSTRHSEAPEASLPSRDAAAPSEPEPESPIEPRPSSYADLPPPGEPGPEPAKEAYGSPAGWDATRPSGDPWATEVMKALQALELPETSEQAAMVRFTLRVCKDGSVRPALVGDASATPLEEQALARLRGVTVPAPPLEVQAKMRSDCARLKYEFQWTERGIR